MVASPVALPLQRSARPLVTWERLPDDYRLPDDPVDNINQPLLADALRDGLETIGLATETTLLPTNYGICATLNGEVAVKAPDWAFVPSISVPRGEVERSYTPHLQGDVPAVVMEFLSATDGGEYSSKQVPPYGKWFFYERILQVANYVIFDPDGGLLEFYRRQEGQYVLEQPSPEGRHWVAEMGLFLGTWRGQRGDRQGYWLRWWTADEQLLLWASERAELERDRADQEQARADREQERANQAEAELVAERERSAQLVAELERLRSGQG
jgi:Uma2 family endonuclease